MSKRTLAAATAALMLAGLLVGLLASPAAAHEERTVGKYHFAVGFGEEPAYAGEKNSVQLFLHDAKDKPVTDLGDTLKVAVSSGGAQPMTLSMEPDFEVGEFGIPGDYRGWFIPTAPGKYTFHFTGTVKGQKVDQSFTSSPTTFDEVQDAASVQYPAKQPTTGQLATLAQRDQARTDAAIAAARTAARDKADSVQNLTVAALVIAVIALLVAVGGTFIAVRRRTRTAAEAPELRHAAP
jgi:hypothetical protein